MCGHPRQGPGEDVQLRRGEASGASSRTAPQTLAVHALPANSAGHAAGTSPTVRHPFDGGGNHSDRPALRSPLVVVARGVPLSGFYLGSG